MTEDKQDKEARLEKARKALLNALNTLREGTLSMKEADAVEAAIGRHARRGQAFHHSHSNASVHGSQLSRSLLWLPSPQLSVLYKKAPFILMVGKK